jgi:hypothetical protein
MTLFGAVFVALRAFVDFFDFFLLLFWLLTRNYHLLHPWPSGLFDTLFAFACLIV